MLQTPYPGGIMLLLCNGHTFLCRRTSALTKGGQVKAIESGEMQDPEVPLPCNLLTGAWHHSTVSILTAPNVFPALSHNLGNHVKIYCNSTMQGQWLLQASLQPVEQAVNLLCLNACVVLIM